MAELKKTRKEIYSTITGIAFIIFAIAAFIVYYKTGTMHYVLWICDHTALIIGLAFLFRKWFWIGAELNLLFLPQLFWSIDFLYRLFFGKFIFGFTDYMFPAYNIPLYIVSLSHIFIIPVALIGLFLALKASGKKERIIIRERMKWSWRGSLMHMLLLMIPSYMLSNSINYNCALKPCFSFLPGGTIYSIIWVLVVFLIVLLTNYLLNKSLKIIR